MRRSTAILLALVLPVAVSACGDDDDDKEASKAALAVFETTQSGKQTKMSGPKSVNAGAVRIEYSNKTKDDASVQLLRIDQGHTAAEAIKAGQAWGDGDKPLPAWVRFVGGTGAVNPGGRANSVQVLKPGNYAGVNIETNDYSAFKVTGDAGGELPETSGTVDAFDYSFKAIELRAGTHQVLFRNRGKEPHFALAAPIKPGKTLEDVRKSLKSERGEPPIIEDETVESGILDGGESQAVEFKLRAGKYAFLCFVPDRKGGPPHAFGEDMISEGTVE